MTIADGLEKCLKKGKGEEQSLAAFNLVLEVLQLGTGNETEQLYTQLKPVLTVIIQNPTAPITTRADVSIGSS